MQKHNTDVMAQIIGMLEKRKKEYFGNYFIVLAFFFLYSFTSCSVFKVKSLIEHLEGYSLNIFSKKKKEKKIKFVNKWNIKWQKIISDM